MANKKPPTVAGGAGEDEPSRVRIVVPQLDIRGIGVSLVGDSPLICNHFAEKSAKQMLDKQMGAASSGRAKKDPEADYLASFYKTPDGRHGFPAGAFKKAALSACSSLGRAISRTLASQAFHVMGDLIPIEGKPRMREDVVKVGVGLNKVADLRYRAEFPKWSCTLTIRYNARALTADQIVGLLSVAGFAVGVGEWRVEKGGNNGMFHVASRAEAD